MKQNLDNLSSSHDVWKKTPTPENMQAFLDAAKPTMQMAVKTYVGDQDPVALSHAKILTAKAAREYNPKKRTKLRTYLLNQLQPLRRLSAQRRFVTHIPEQVQYEMTGLDAAEQELRDKLDRDPSDAELADATKLSLKRIRHLRGFSRPAAEASFVSDTNEPMDIPVAFSQASDEWADYVYHDLSQSDRKIMEWRTGYGGHARKSPGEIARQLGLSPAAITKRSRRIAEVLSQGARRR